MSGITIEQAVDLGYATLQAFSPGDIEMTLKHQTYEVVNRWLTGDRKKLNGGDRVNYYLSLKDTGNAQHVRDYETDSPNVANTDVEASVNWVHAQTSFTYTMKELNMNTGNRTRVYDMFKTRRLNCLREFADMLEESGWKTPSSATDDRAPHGIPAWICQADADGSTGDFNGYVGDYTVAVNSTEAAYANVAGIPCTSTTNTRFANFYADHNDQINDSCLKLLRRAFRNTKFQTPIVAKQAIDPSSDFSNFRLYTNSAVLDELEELAVKSDDSIGADLGKYAGGTIFKGIPFKYVDSLNNNLIYVYGGNPIFGINHNHFYGYILDGEDFRLNKPMNKVGQHNVFTVYYDLTYAYVCKNRRTGGFLISDWENGNA